MAKSKTKPAFPGRSNAMGYEPGLTKLEWIVTQLITGAVHIGIQDAISKAAKIIKACEDAEANVSSENTPT